jgi:hypothetical protein
VNNVVGGAQYKLDFTVLRRGVWVGHPEVHTMSKDELPRGGVVELTHVVTLDALNLATKLSADKIKELGDSRKGVRLQSQWKSPRVVREIFKNDKIIFRIQDANNWSCPKITMNKMKTLCDRR